MKTLNLTDYSDKYLRFYKKYLYWQLVSDNREFCEMFEKSLKSIRFVEDTNLRYEYLPQSLKESLTKKIQRIVYQKEASELKASPDKTTNTNTTNNLNNNYGSNNSNSNDGFSWRKKSNDLTNEKVKDESKTGNKIVNSRFNDGRNSFNDNNYTNTTNSNNNYNYNNLPKMSSFENVPIKRERFNSDGDKGFQGFSQTNKPTYNSYNTIFGNNIKLDYSKLNVNYATESK